VDKVELEKEVPMAVIIKSFKIPEDRHLHLDLPLPDDFPVGKADVLVSISPDLTGEPLVPLSELAGCLKDNPNFAGDPMEVQRRIRFEVWGIPPEED
jgi:hypothetical protein